MYQHYCKVCHEQILDNLSALNVFQRLAVCCTSCTEKFQIETINRCPSCQKKLRIDEEQCEDCLFLKKHFNMTHSVDFISDYTDEVQSIIHQYKSMNDVALAEALAEILLKHFPRKYFSAFDYVVPMPSSPERLMDRGFDHVQLVMYKAHIKTEQLLKTKHRPKQMALSKSERIFQENPFEIAKDFEVNKRILLVDDIYTTGLTMSHASSVLLRYKHCEIKVLAFARV